MSITLNDTVYYVPREVADRLGVSVGMLRYYRNMGYIKGTRMGGNTVYTEEQIAAFKPEQKSTGPRLRLLTKEEEATCQ